MSRLADKLKAKSTMEVEAVLLRDAPLVLEWISSTDLNETSVERGKQLQALLDAARKPFLEEIGERSE